MILPKEKVHGVHFFMPLRPIKSRSENSNSLNSVIFAELELANISGTRLKINRVRSPDYNTALSHNFIHSRQNNKNIITL